MLDLAKLQTILEKQLRVAQQLDPKLPLSVKMAPGVLEEVLRLERGLNVREKQWAAVVQLIRLAGDDPTRPGLKDTPERVVRSYRELFSGYGKDLEQVLKMFEDGAGGYDEMVVQKDIQFYSTCEHHMLPFMGKVHVAYLPDRKIVGLSKMARLVEVFARRLQVQERITVQVADAMEKYLTPKGVAVCIEAEHLCIACRGANKQKTVTTTSALRGAFKADPATRAEFFQLVKG